MLIRAIASRTQAIANYWGSFLDRYCARSRQSFLVPGRLYSKVQTFLAGGDCIFLPGGAGASFKKFSRNFSAVL
jgi:hypothetical protein